MALHLRQKPKLEVSLYERFNHSFQRLQRVPHLRRRSNIDVDFRILVRYFRSIRFPTIPELLGSPQLLYEVVLTQQPLDCMEVVAALTVLIPFLLLICCTTFWLGWLVLKLLKLVQQIFVVRVRPISLGLSIDTDANLAQQLDGGELEVVICRKQCLAADYVI